LPQPLTPPEGLQEPSEISSYLGVSEACADAVGQA
jgi:hypothetical protein